MSQLRYRTRSSPKLFVSVPIVRRPRTLRLHLPRVLRELLGKAAGWWCFGLTQRTDRHAQMSTLSEEVLQKLFQLRHLERAGLPVLQLWFLFCFDILALTARNRRGCHHSFSRSIQGFLKALQLLLFPPPGLLLVLEKSRTLLSHKLH